MQEVSKPPQFPPLVSIGLPVRNGENYLREALNSLLDQTYRNIEIIISDNASTDATEAIAKEYLRSDHRIRYFRQPCNIGPSGNYRFVLDKALGEYFMWAAHDDTFDNNWIQVLLTEIQPGDLGVRGAIRFIHSQGIYIRHLRNYRRNAQLSCFLGNEHNYRCHYVYSLFRRNELTSCDFSAFSLDYSPDNLFIFSILRRGNLRSTKKTAMSFRLHSANLGSEYSAKWKGIRKIAYRIHPLRYYIYHLRFIDSPSMKALFVLSIPPKHIYAQLSFWLRGARELISGKSVI
jgi:glycosyltransferase involved in cell wall biosynthesis